MQDISKKGLNTQIIHAGQSADPVTGAVTVPIYQASTFAFKNADHGAASFRGDEDGGFIYTRLGNPTIMALEESVTTLEKGFGGMACATGMAAVNLVYYGLLSQGDHVVCGESVYGPSRMVLETEYPRFGISATFVDASDTEAVAAALRPETRLVYLETPANPNLTITDLAAVTALAHDHGATVCVDNTFASPLLQNPLDFGADLVLHSMTKFINGHTDVVAGMLVAREEELYRRLLKVHKNLGGTMDPHQAWLVLRGIKSLGLRMEKAQANCLRLAKFLEQHPRIDWVRYPFLESHPQYELARRQMRGGGAVMSFGVSGGLEGGKKLMDNLEVCTLAVSLGGIETLIEHPASMTHAGVSRAEREKAGISDDLVRIAVGCEDYEDLEADLARVLDSI